MIDWNFVEFQSECMRYENEIYSAVSDEDWAKVKSLIIEYKDFREINKSIVDNLVAKVMFKGKNYKNEWVYGSLIKYKDYCCILEYDKEDDFDFPYLDYDGCIDGYATPVDPKSVEIIFMEKNNG